MVLPTLGQPISLSTQLDCCKDSEFYYKKEKGLSTWALELEGRLVRKRVPDPHLDREP